MANFFFYLLIPFYTFAFRISPIELDFSNKGPQSVQTMMVENTTKKKIPVEVNVLRRRHVNGKELRSPTNDFSYFPKRFILKPGQKRNVRLTWMGEKKYSPAQGRTASMAKGNTNISNELAYRMEVKQVPVNLKKKANKTGINFLYNYVASLYVRPEGGEPLLKVTSFKKKSPFLYEFKIKNIGAKHAILGYFNLNVYPGGAKKPVVLKMLRQNKDIQSINMLSGESRTIKIKVPVGLLNSRGELKFVFKKST